MKILSSAFKKIPAALKVGGKKTGSSASPAKSPRAHKIGPAQERAKLTQTHNDAWTRIADAEGLEKLLYAEEARVRNGYCQPHLTRNDIGYPPEQLPQGEGLSTAELDAFTQLTGTEDSRKFSGEARNIMAAQGGPKAVERFQQTPEIIEFKDPVFLDFTFGD